MKKTIALLLVLVLSLSVLAGCAQSRPQPTPTPAPTEEPAAETEAEAVEEPEQAEEPAEEAEPAEEVAEPAEEETITVVDHTGVEVTLPKNIERIAVCDIYPLPSVLAIFFNSADKIVAMSPNSMSAAQNSLLGELYPEILNADTSAISASDVNAEELMKLDPQVVFTGTGSPQTVENLRNAGFNVYVVSANKWDYNVVETLNQWMISLSEIFPGNDRTDLVRKFSDESMALINERVGGLSDEERARVFFLFNVNPNAIVTSGTHFFGQWWAEAVGAVNVAAELEGDNQVQVTLEQVYEWNPQQILITNFTPSVPDDLYTNNIGSYDWSSIDAVENGKVYKMPLGMYRSYTPGIDTPITLLWLAKTVYPDLFEDVDITAKTVEYYETVFGVTLTSEQAEKIFDPSLNAGKVVF